MAVKDLLTKLIKENKQIIFNGNNYADSWQKEAAKRGLLNHKTSVDAFGEVLKPEVTKAFEKYGVLNARELKARYEIALEQYIKTINIEGQLMVLMANRYILPAAYKYQGRWPSSVAAVKAAGGDVEGRKEDARPARQADRRVQAEDRQAAGALEHEGDGGAEKHAKFFRDKVVPAMVSLRETGDALESIVPHEGWPLPTYREMLFIRVGGPRGRQT